MCRKKYQNNEQIMTMAEETKLIAKLRRLAGRRETLNEQIAELQDKRTAVEEEFAALTAVRERQRVLLRRRATHLDAANILPEI